MLSDITIVPDMPTEFGFTGEQTDPLNDLVYLRARHLNPRLGIFGSLDPFEGEMSEPLTWNGYGWVEGNTPNLTDATGMSNGACDQPCAELWEHIRSLIDEINHRLEDLFNDPCYLYEQLKEESIPPLSENCYKTITTWDSHVRTIEDRQKGLKNTLNCNLKKKSRFSASAPISDHNCGTQNPLYSTALAAVAKVIDDNVKLGRKGGTKVVVESAIVVTSPSIEPVPVSTPDFTRPLGTAIPPQVDLNTGRFPAKTATPLAQLITPSTAVNPYQSNTNSALSSDVVGTLMLGIGVVGAICIAVALSPAIASVGASAATAYAVNPQLCLVR